MKRARLAVLVATAAFAATAFAATPVPVPPDLPQSLETTWQMDDENSCTRKDKVVITFKAYEMQDAKTIHTLYLMTKNNELVHQFEGILNKGIRTGTYDGYVKKADGTWMHYDWLTERVEAEAAIANIVGMTGREFISCVLGK